MGICDVLCLKLRGETIAAFGEDGVECDSDVFDSPVRVGEDEELNALVVEDGREVEFCVCVGVVSTCG